ncbi:SDR family NAD(P)-dependent oxidoreductase [Falsigemmobacter faecalis]|uniref:SDR family NAD(P)-dependent oxidoreductase n=2 Tax=Falsigemmobacter faecalis TaxID=2488730 RepID=A0A3P3DX33_9RHOB|nr:SDR family NAD(P)-dependent oxidoreductase [Falsigemmobacter faecalis]
MAAHLPGAKDVAGYWQNLCAGLESIRRLSPEDLAQAGEDPARMRRSNYVPAAVVLDGFEEFDAEFFGLSPKEAAIMDPQHRQFLEVSWEALEDAGHPPGSFAGPTGVFAGCGMGSYFYFNICSNPDLVQNTGMFLLRHTGNDKDFLPTRVSHIFDLKGPSITVQTACSTSLVAVHLAVQSLLSGESDMALAGGVTIELPHGRGYLYQDGEILSPDGHCHAFDHRAQGTIFGSGAGCVVLRRLKDALADGDQIHAVIRGTAVNNDGAAKAGYLAPSVDGQAAAIREAHQMAGVAPETIGYVECHGTGTWLGDPIEVAALTEAFRTGTDRGNFAKIGSVKTNIGHLDTAAGVASLIKASLAVREGQIPPSLGYEAPNPAIAFEGSPFSVNDRLSEFPRLGAPRRAGVNSLGVGGTNAHVIVEEPPARPAPEESDWPFQLLTLSARSKKALDAASLGLATHLRAQPDLNLADVAFTLKEGRRPFEHNRVLVAESPLQAAEMLETGDRYRVFTQSRAGTPPEVVFMFPGGGAQYIHMAHDLYETEPVFREWMDRGFAVLGSGAGDELRRLWLPAPGEEAAAAADLTRRPSRQLPLIMMVEYALAQLWMSWGVEPDYLIGHSMGENTAAALAGVMSFEDCLRLVRLRGELFDSIPKGGMLSVPLPEAELRRELGDSLDLASVNAPGLCVVSGPDAGLETLAQRLAGRGIDTIRVPIDIAAHSRMLEPILKPFGDFLRSINLAAPQKIIISNRSGKPLTAAEAMDPDYWVMHLRGTVQFAAGISWLSAEPRIFLEAGPGKALSSLAQANGLAAERVVSSLRHPDQILGDDLHFVTMFGRLWGLGLPLDWAPLWGGMARRRLSLPTYPFQRSRYFIEPGQAHAAQHSAPMLQRSDDLSTWGWQGQWRPRETGGAIAAELAAMPAEDWLIFADAGGVMAALADRLRGAGQRVVTVAAGDRSGGFGTDRITLAAELGREGYDLLIRDLSERGQMPRRILHGWLLDGGAGPRPGSDLFQQHMEQGFWSLFWLSQSLIETGISAPVQLTALTTGAVSVSGEALAFPQKSTIDGVLKVLPRELPGMSCAQLDLALPLENADLLLEEALAAPLSGQAALRGGRRFAAQLRPMPLPAPVDVKPGAVVLITGGFGGIAQSLAADLATRSKARIGLLSRRPLPPEAEWDAVLSRSPAGPEAARIRQIRALQTAGAQVLALTGEVSNLQDMQAAKAALQAEFGPVDLVIHAAGTVDDGPLLSRSEAAIDQVFAPKIQGTRVLDAVFPADAPCTIVVFASTSTVIGAAGQVDYVAANAFLNAWAQARTGGARRVVALNWGIWADIGMAAAAAGETASDQPLEGAPLLSSLRREADGRLIFSGHWTIRDWWLDGHRTRAGEALLPGTGSFDLLASALAASGHAGGFTLRDISFLSPLAVTDSRDIRLVLRPAAGGWRFTLQSRVQAGGTAGWQSHSEGEVDLSAPAKGIVDLASLRLRCGAAIAGEGLRSPQEAHLSFGPRWRVLRSQAMAGGEGLAELQLPEAFAGDLTAGHRAHPALLDLATGWAMALIPGYRPDHLWVPVSYHEVSFLAPLPARIFSHVRLSETGHAESGSVRFDVTLTDPEGRVLCEVTGFEIRRLDHGLSFPAPDPRSLEPLAESIHHSPGQERLREALALGIRAAEGGEAFRRALAAGQSPVYVTPVPLPDLIRAADAEATPAPVSETGFARPELDSDFIAPRSAVEKQLAALWSELLGVAEVGVEDSFFDLGGHSLIAVRLFAQIRRLWSVDLPMSVLFEAPTIAACAALIEARIGPQDGGDAAVPAAAAPVVRRTHLVAMHPATAPMDQAPLFVVAGMFGNVLNLRHMAQLIGKDRPFYGLQARGLFGDAQPHDDFVEAATDYLAEMREVHPGGPWLLGGFSGGGLIAWEMARQLEAAGEVVAGVVLLDTPQPLAPRMTKSDAVRVRLQGLLRGGAGYWRAWQEEKRAYARELALAERGEAEGQHQNRAIEAAFRAALPGYSVERREGPVMLYRPAPDPRWQVGGRMIAANRDYIYPDNLWTPYAPGLEIIEVPGDHDSMVLEPNVRVLTADLRRRLRAVSGAGA